MEFADITNVVKAAATTLSVTNPLLHGADYNPEISLHTIEMMDPRTDTGADKTALPPVVGRIEDGSLPMSATALQPSEVVSIMDKILQLHSSYLYGNTVPQTLLTSLYTHPEAIATLCKLVGREGIYKHATGPIGPTLFPEHIVGNVFSIASLDDVQSAAAQTKPAASANVKPFAPGTKGHALCLALLAYVLGTLKSVGTTHENICAEELLEEEDCYPNLFGCDLAWAVPLQQVLALLQDAEKAVLSAESSASSAAAALYEAAVSQRLKGYEADPIPEGVEDSDSEDGGAAVVTKTSGGGKKQKKKEKKSSPAAGSDKPAAAAVGSGSGSGAPSKPAATGALDTFSIDAVAAPASSSAHSVIGDASAAANLVARLRFLRSYLVGQHYLSADQSKAAAAPLMWGSLFNVEAAHAAFTSAYDFLTAINKTSALASETAEAPVAVPGVFPTYDRLFLDGQRPRFVPIAPFAGSMLLLAKHIVAATFVTQMRALVSHNPHRPMQGMIKGLCVMQQATVSLSDLIGVSKAIGSAASWPDAKDLQEPGLIARDAKEWPLPVPKVPSSGLTDGPLNWVPLPRQTKAEQEASMAAAATTGTRPHVSMHALFLLLEDFSRRNADVLARSWLHRVVMASPSQPALDSVDGLTGPMQDILVDVSGQRIMEEPGQMPRDPYWQYAAARSIVLFGTHTLNEVIEGSMRDVGVPAEFLFSVEGRRYVELTEVAMGSSVLQLFATRARAWRGLEAGIRDWSVVVSESDALESQYTSYCETRIRTLVAHARQGIVAPASLPTLTPELDGTTFTAAVPSDIRLMHLLRRHSQITFACSHWSSWFATYLLLTHVRIGVETGIFHNDEAMAVQWHLETLNRKLQALNNHIDVGRSFAWHMPELGVVSEESRKLSEAGTGPLLRRDLAPMQKALEKAEAAIKAAIDAETKEGDAEAAANALAEIVSTSEFGEALEAAEQYLKSLMPSITGRRDTLRNQIQVQADLLHTEAAIRLLLVSKIAGSWSGLGIEASGARSEEDMASMQATYQTIIAGRVKWTPAPGSTQFRHPVLAYDNRWHLFKLYQLFPVSFIGYVKAFAFTPTLEVFRNTSLEVQKYGQTVLRTIGGIVGYARLATSGAVQPLAEPGSTFGKPEESEKKAIVSSASSGSSKGGKAGKKGGKGKEKPKEEAEEEKKQEMVISAPSSFTVLMSTRDIAQASQLQHSMVAILETAQGNVEAVRTRVNLDYRIAVVAADEEAWSAERIAADAAAGSTAAQEALRAATVKAAVTARKLEVLENDHTKALASNPSLAAANLQLPSRAAMQSPFLYEMMRAGGTIRTEMRQAYDKAAADAKAAGADSANVSFPYPAALPSNPAVAPAGGQLAGTSSAPYKPLVHVMSFDNGAANGFYMSPKLPESFGPRVPIQREGQRR